MPKDLSIEQHLYILEIQSASAPVLEETRKEVIFTFSPQSNQQLVLAQGYQNQSSLSLTNPHRVFIAFGHEQYRVLHPMDRSPHGVYFYFFQYNRTFQEDHDSLEYRYVVDGVWMADPLNSMARSLLSGVQISRFILPQLGPLPEQAPLQYPATPGLKGKNVRFVYEAPSGKDIYLSGSFNGWDPFLYRFRERLDAPGVYELTIHLNPGVHHYQFVSEGQRHLDPLNPNYGRNPEGVVYSRLEVVN